MVYSISREDAGAGGEQSVFLYLGMREGFAVTTRRARDGDIVGLTT